jgi:hypothetical protein
VPLDDGARDGTEPWREIEGVQFCHWDRWLLRLALEEPSGLESIAREFRRRASASRRVDDVAEAMLAQLADLELRLARLGRTPANVLDNVERVSGWLQKKAFRRIWHSRTVRRTAAMQRTPRVLLHRRALSGNWTAFLRSPASYYAELKKTFAGGPYDYRTSGLIVTLLEHASEELLHASTDDDERLAIERAILTVCIEGMEQVDDSLDDLGQFFREHEEAYLALVRWHMDTRGIVRDLLELVVWEDYGLFSEVEPFLCSLAEPEADVALRVLAAIIAELRAANLDRQLDGAQRLRRVLLGAAAVPERHDGP